MRECADTRITPGMKEIELAKVQEEVEACSEIAERFIRTGKADKAQSFINRSAKLREQIRQTRMELGEERKNQLEE